MTYASPDFNKPGSWDSPRTALLKFTTALEALGDNLTQWDIVRADIISWADEYYPALPPPPQVVQTFNASSGFRDVFGDGEMRADYAYIHVYDNNSVTGEMGIWEVGRLGPFDGPIERELPAFRRSAGERVWVHKMLDEVEKWLEEK